MTRDALVPGRHAGRHKNGEREIKVSSHERRGGPGHSMGNPLDIDSDNEVTNIYSDQGAAEIVNPYLKALGGIKRDGHAEQRSFHAMRITRDEGREAREEKANGLIPGRREERELQERRAKQVKPAAGSSPYMLGRNSMGSSIQQATNEPVPSVTFYSKTANDSTPSKQRNINNSRGSLSAAPSSQANLRYPGHGDRIPSNGTRFDAHKRHSPDWEDQHQPDEPNCLPQSSTRPISHKTSTELSLGRPANFVPSANNTGACRRTVARSSQSPQPEYAQDGQSGLQIREVHRPPFSSPRARQPLVIENTADKKGKGKERNLTRTPNLDSRYRSDEVSDKIRDPDGPFTNELLEAGIEVISPPVKPQIKEKHRLGSQIEQLLPIHLTDRSTRITGLRGSSRMKNKEGHAAVNRPHQDSSRPGTVPSQRPPCPAEVENISINGKLKLTCKLITVGSGGLQVHAFGKDFWQIKFQDIRELGVCKNPAHPSAYIDIPSPRYRDTEIVESMLKGSGQSSLDQATANARLKVLLLLKSGQTTMEALDALRNRVDEKEHIPSHTENCVKLTNRLQEDIHKNAGVSDKHSKPPSTLQRLSPSPESIHQPNIKSTSKSGTKSKDNQEEENGQRKTKGKPKQQDPTQSKLQFTAGPSHRRSTRLSGAQSDRERSSSRSFEPKMVAKSVVKVNKNELHFPYPLTGRADVNVTYGDSMRLQEGEFLNDTLLEFGLRYVLAELHQELRETIHLFNSFFYNKLADRSKKSKRKDDAWPAYDSVKKWTKGKDIFKKKFIVVPINESYHWYLAVIVNPGGMLRRKVIPIPIEVDKPVTRSSALLFDDSESDSSKNLVSKNPVDDVDEDDLDVLASDQEGERVSFPTQGSTCLEMPGQYPAGPNQSMISNDPLDCIGDDSDVIDVENEVRSVHISQGVKDMRLVDGAEMDDQDDDLCSRSGDDSGKPINTATLLAFQEQNRHQSPVEQAASPKKKAMKPDAEIVGSENTWILTFDSLGGSHKAVHTVLDSWLKYEARDKLNIDYEPEDATYWEAKVPQQNNFYDCGLYVIQFAKQLLARQDLVLNFIQRRAPSLTSPDRPAYDALMTEAWKSNDTGNLRQEWINIITTVASNYTSVRDALAVGGQRQATPDNATTSQDDQPSITAIEPTAQIGQPTDYDIPMESRQQSEHSEDELPYRRTPVKSPDNQVTYTSSSTLPLVDASSSATAGAPAAESGLPNNLEKLNTHIYLGQEDGDAEKEVSKSDDIDPSILSVSFDGPYVLETLEGLEAVEADQEIIVDNEDDESEISEQDRISHTSGSLPRQVESSPSEVAKYSLSPPLIVSDGSPFQSLSNHAPGAKKPTTPQPQPLPIPVHSSPTASMRQSGSSSWKISQRYDLLPSSRERIHEVFNPSSSSNMISSVDSGVNTSHPVNEASVLLHKVGVEDDPMSQAVNRQRISPLQTREHGNGDEEDEEEEPVENRPASGKKSRNTREAKPTEKPRTYANKAVSTSAGAKRSSSDTGAGLSHNKRSRRSVGTSKDGKKLPQSGEGDSRDVPIEIESSDDDH